MKNMNSMSGPVAKCQKVNGPASARSIFAETMAKAHRSDKCNEHGQFHNWVAVEGEPMREAKTAGLVARFDGYVEVSPGKWALRDTKPAKKKVMNVVIN